MIEAIVLAAGLSSRMGEVNKLTLPLQGQPIIVRTVEALLVSKIDNVIVVTGHESEVIEPLLEGFAIEIIYNEKYYKGQLTSIQKGLSSLSQNCTGFMICLSDMPLLTAEDYNVLITTYQHHVQEEVIVLPEKSGRKGNPKIFHPSFMSSILALDPKLYQGAKAVMQQYPHRTISQAISNECFFTDMDTLEDYERLQKLCNDNKKE